MIRKRQPKMAPEFDPVFFLAKSAAAFCFLLLFVWAAIVWQKSIIIDNITSLATITVAVFTALLAIETRSLAAQTQAGLAQGAIQYELQVSPFLVARDARVDRANNTISFRVQNIGTGPAILARVEHFASGKGLDKQTITTVHNFSPLSPGEQSPQITSIPLPVHLTHLVVTVSFENVFGVWGQSQWIVNIAGCSALELSPCGTE